MSRSLLAVLLSAALLCFAVAQPATQVSVCHTTFSNTIAEATNGQYWAAQTYLTLTLNTSAAYGSFASAGVVAVTGSRTVSDAQGLGTVAGSVAVQLLSTAACSGCDNVLYFPQASPYDYFDVQGLALQLSAYQSDLSYPEGCMTQQLVLRAGNVTLCVDNDMITGYNTMTVAPFSAAARSACVPPVLTIPTQSYCGVGLYNFTAMSKLSDLSYYDGYWTHLLRVCGAVTQAECVAAYGSNVQACQYHGIPGYSVNVEAAYNAPTGETSWGYAYGDATGSSGVVFNISDGLACGGNGPRKVNGVITCGTANRIVTVSESPVCTYNYVLTSPLACPPTQTFGFCAVTSTSLPATSSNWVSVLSGTLTGSKLTGQSQYTGVNLLSSPTYLVTAIAATVQLSSIGTAATTVAQGTAQNGTVAAANLPVSLLPAGSYGGNDNVVYYADANGSTPFLFTTNAGVSLSFVTGGKMYAINLWSLSNYFDNLTNAQTTAIVTYRIGSTPPAACYPPVYTPNSATTGQLQTFQYCGVTYSSSVFDEYASTAYYSSRVAGTLTAISTSVLGQYLVTSLTGTRYTTASDGYYTQTGVASVSLTPGASSFVYLNSSYIAMNGALDSRGLAMYLQGGALQGDPTGCGGSQFIYTGYGIRCAQTGGTYTAYSNLANTFTMQVASSSSPLQCNPVLYPAPAYVCGIGLFDFSSLKNNADLSLNMNGYTIYLRLCGAVAQQDCVRQFGQNAMICQWGSSTNLYELSSNVSPFGEPQFSYLNGQDGSSGITMFIQDGQQCNAQVLYPRTTNITILCGATTQLVSYNEGATCQYYLTLITPLACPPPAPFETGAAYCGIGNHNFTLLAYSNDITTYAGGYDWFVRLCGAVRNQAVVRQLGGYNSMVVQYSPAFGSYQLAATNNPAGGTPLSFAYANGVDGSAGINYTIQDGAACGAILRSVKGTITCGTNNGILQIYENPPCTYNIFFQTPLACNGGYGSTVPSSGLQLPNAQTRTFAYCIISYATNLVPGYSVWSSVLSGVLVAQQTAAVQGWPIYQITAVNGTRSVAKSDLSGTVGSTVSVTRVEPAGATCFGNCNNLLYFVPGNNNNNTAWFDGNGLTLDLTSAQVDLVGCNGTAINIGYGSLYCFNNGATTKSTTSYTVSVVPLTGPGSAGATAPACAPPTQTLQVAVPAQCGVGAFDFSSLATYGDLSITSGGYTIYARLCGAVSQPDCVSAFGFNAQFCQWASSTSQYEMATLYAPPYESETTFTYANGNNGNGGVNYFVKDGANCSINGVQVPRSVQGTITCGTANALTYFAEVATCQYVVNMTSPLACVPTNTYSMCYIAYSNVISDYSTQVAWSSLLQGTFTTSATLPASGVRSATITSFTGTRSVASNDGLGRPLSSTAVTLGSTSTCANCDNLFFWPAPASGPFDNQGLQLQLAQYQIDSGGCGGTVLTIKQYGLVQCGNGGAEQVTNPSNSIQIYPVTAGVATPACTAPVLTIPAYTCGLGLYDFSPLRTLSDITGSFGGYVLYMRLCGAVTQPDCVALYGNNVQICQWAGKGSAYVQAINNSPTGETVFSYVNGVDGAGGIRATIKDGQLCGSLGPRQAIVTLVCGTNNAITSYSESTTCVYSFTVTTPLACPPTQTFGFCAVTSNGPNPAYNNWYTVASGVLNTTRAVPTNLDSAVNLYSAPTYLATSIIGGQIAISALGQNPTSGGSNANGVPQATAPLTLLPANVFGGNDNRVYYLNTGNIPLLWTTGAGLSWSYTTGGKGVSGNLYSLNSYFDSNTLGAGVYATVTYALLAPGTSSYSCPAPQLAQSNGAGTSVTFQFCYISYVSNIYGEYANTIYPASVTTGSMGASLTGNQGQYKVNSVSGTRTYYVADGTYALSPSTSTVSLGPGTSYVYYNSPLVANYSTTDSAGLALNVANALATASPDPAGCAGSPIYLQGSNEQCPTINTTSVYNQLVLSPNAGGSPLTCAPIQYAPQSWQCGIGPFDFSSLKNLGDLNLTINGYTIFTRLCSAVAQPDCVRQFGRNNMICQWGSSTNLYELSSNLSPFGTPAWSYINGFDANNGISMVIADGQQCNSGLLYPRVTNITILCGATTQLVNYYEGDTCHYYLTLLTPLACPAPAPVVSATGYCGLDNFNFTLLALSNDIVGEFPGQSIWFRLCGAVRETACVNTFGYTSQACQLQDGGSTYSLASATTGAGQTSFSYVTPGAPDQGIRYSINNGQLCGGAGARTLSGVITCGVDNTMLAFAETSTCRYTVNITTPLACNGGIGAAPTYSLLPTNPTQTQYFGYCVQSYASNIINGYQIWSSTASGVFTTTAGYSPFYTVTQASGTRITAASDYSGATNSTATISLAPVGQCIGGCSNYIYYNPTVGTTPYLDGTGVALMLSQVQTDITGCSGGQITLGYSQISCSGTGPATATYTFQLIPQTTNTAPACAKPAASTPPLVLENQPVCGVGGVSFLPLAQGPDLNITVGGVTVFGRLCGAVTQPDCVRSFGTNSQFCQWYSPSSQYEMASLKATSGETIFGYVNGKDSTLGYTYYVADGATCNIAGTNVPRSVTGNITCGAVSNFTSFYELSATTGNSSLICHYVVNMLSPLACPGGVAPGQGSSNSGGGGSSLSGGAIAGIVIGSVVGAILLLAIMLFICCGAGMAKGGSRGAKAAGPEGGGVEHSGKFAPQEESQVQSTAAHETGDEGLEMAEKA